MYPKNIFRVAVRQALFSDVCTIVEENGCDATNVALLNLARCVAEDLYSCTGFTNCEDATTTPAPGAVTSTAFPTGAPTSAPTIAPTIATTPAPTAGDRGVEETGPAANAGSGRFAALDAAMLPIFSLVLACGMAVLFG